MKNEVINAINDSRSDASGKFQPNWGKAARLLSRRQGISLDEAFALINDVRLSN